MDVLGTPLEYRVEREYLGPDSKHAVAQPGGYSSTSAMEVPMDVLGTPLEYRVEREYLGPDSKHVVAQPGDYVVVCAWIQNHTTALAYSENNSSIGKIPASCLNLQDSKPAFIDGVYLALANQNVSGESFWDIG